MPATLLLISYKLSTVQLKASQSRDDQQMKASQSHDDQQKLLEAYGQFGAVMSDLNVAIDTVQLLGLGQHDVPKAEVKQALSAVDRSFIGVAYRLTPFKLIEEPTLYKSGPLQDTWDNCFSQSYHSPYNADTKDKGYWSQLQSLVASCQDDKDGTCPIQSVRQMSAVLSNINQPTCHGTMFGIKGRNMGWIWQHLSLEIVCQRTSNVSACLEQTNKPAETSASKPS